MRKQLLLNFGMTLKKRRFLKQLRGKKRWVESYDEIRSTFEDLLVLQEFAKEDPESEKNWMKLFLSWLKN